MNKILLAIIISLIPLSAYADTGLSEASPTASNTAIVTPPHKVGECVSMLGGLWQQLSDGTWADPNDSINTCKKNQSGQSSTVSIINTLAGIAAMIALNKSAGSLGMGGLSTSQWLTNCVLYQSMMVNPACQALGSLLGTSGLTGNAGNLGLYSSLLGGSGLMGNVGNTGLYGSLASNLLYSQLGMNTGSNALFSGTNGFNLANGTNNSNQGLAQTISLLATGWTIGHFL